MNKKYTREEVSINDLVLDCNNPRFSELYSGNNEDDIIEYLLYNEDAKDIAKNILKNQEFYEDKPLWVIKKYDKFLVKDGNRRCSAIKALQDPLKYKLSLQEFKVNELPVLVYNNEDDLDERIRESHTGSLFKKWGRIAKALEIFRLHSKNESNDKLNSIDTNYKELLKIASFYYEAVKIKGDEFKNLVREGRGATGGKTIIFERLFRAKELCGYTFGRGENSGIIRIKDQEKFNSYITSIVEYLIDNPSTKTHDIDNVTPNKFVEKLNIKSTHDFTNNIDSEANVNAKTIPPETHNNTSHNASSSGFSHQNDEKTNNAIIQNSSHNSSTNTTEDETDSQNNDFSRSNTAANNDTVSKTRNSKSRYSKKSNPTLKRKGIPSKIKILIDECYKLKKNEYPNAKIALTRVTFECTLKYIVEETKRSNGNSISKANHFKHAFKDKKGNPLPTTNFDVLKSKFTSLIKDNKIKRAFEDFKLERSHQIIHNYMVCAVPNDAQNICNNLIPLLEFMLQDESALLENLEIETIS